MILAVSKLKNLPSLPTGYRGRFAPSPTGPLHAGSLLAALGSWLDARKNGGKWLLRIEDLDTPRCSPGAAEQIQSQLLACGLFWDEEIIYQSTRQKLYQEALERINQLRELYPCHCSRQTITNALATQGIQTPRNQEMVYPGLCRPKDLKVNTLEAGDLKQAWRIALPEDCVIEFEDLAMGKQHQDLNEEVGDFVLRRSDGLFAYQLAVVVDDALQGISHVVRGADLLNNTARQIYLQKILELPTPQYRHLPLVLDEHGEKLSKQTQADAIDTRDDSHVLTELRKAAIHLGLSGLPEGSKVTVADWLASATQAWQS
jgi:glutamyl-Q tRNA(Asp) synthetase